jgi:hypothetical protein
LTYKEAIVVLTEFGFKPNEVFSERALWVKVEKLFGALGDKQKTETVMNVLNNSSALEVYFRFISKHESK